MFAKVISPGTSERTAYHTYRAGLLEGLYSSSVSSILIIRKGGRAADAQIVPITLSDETLRDDSPLNPSPEFPVRNTAP